MLLVNKHYQKRNLAIFEILLKSLGIAHLLRKTDPFRLVRQINFQRFFSLLKCFPNTVSKIEVSRIGVSASESNWFIFEREPLKRIYLHRSPISERSSVLDPRLWQTICIDTRLCVDRVSNSFKYFVIFEIFNARFHQVESHLRRSNSVLVDVSHLSGIFGKIFWKARSPASLQREVVLLGSSLSSLVLEEKRLLPLKLDAIFLFIVVDQSNFFALSLKFD
jgi:hypothetical protein